MEYRYVEGFYVEKLHIYCKITLQLDNKNDRTLKNILWKIRRLSSSGSCGTLFAVLLSYKQKRRVNMKVKSLTIALVVLYLVLGLFSVPSFAVPILHFTFDQPTGVVGPTDSIVVNATLTNDATSREAVTTPTAATISTGGFFPSYNFTWGPSGSNDLFTQFVGLNLLPGQSFHFVLGTFAPSGGSVSDGTYSINYAFLYFSSFPLTLYAENSFSRTVSSSVPEPSTILLLGSAMVGVGLTRLRKSGRNA